MMFIIHRVAFFCITIFQSNVLSTIVVALLALNWSCVIFVEKIGKWYYIGSAMFIGMKLLSNTSKRSYWCNTTIGKKI